MVDLRAAVYQSEATLTQTDGSLRAEEQRRREKRKADSLGGLKARNRGVAERDAADIAYERGEAARVEEALRRKAEVYDALQRGDPSAVPDHSLVDFELKQLTGDDAPAGHAQFAPPGQPRAFSAPQQKHAAPMGAARPAPRGIYVNACPSSRIDQLAQPRHVRPHAARMGHAVRAR